MGTKKRTARKKSTGKKSTRKYGKQASKSVESAMRRRKKGAKVPAKKRASRSR